MNDADAMSSEDNAVEIMCFIATSLTIKNPIKDCAKNVLVGFWLRSNSPMWKELAFHIGELPREHVAANIYVALFVGF